MRSSEAPAGAPVLTVDGLAKAFRIHHLESSLPIFANVDLKLCAGEFILLAGPNGAGKSTLLRTLYRSCRPTGGRALYHAAEGDIDLARAADVDIALLRARDIGFVTQFLQARPRISAEDLVAEPLRQAGEVEEVARAAARRELEALGVKSALWSAYPSTFSGGERQKVNLARALISPRRLLLLDEPTASLDIGAREALTHRLTELKAQGVAMIGVFHHASDVAALVDREFRLEPTVAA